MMLTGEIITLYYITLLLVTTDIIITFYFFFVMKKKNCHSRRHEKNWLPRMILGERQEPWRLIVGVLLNVILLGFIMKLGTIAITIIFGAFTMLHRVHWQQYIEMKKLWDNKHYWNKYEELLLVEKRSYNEP